MKLTWKRGRSDELETSSRMTWESEGGRFKIQRLVSKYKLPLTILAVDSAGGVERIIYRGKSRSAAEAACRAQLQPAAVEAE